MVSQSPEAGFFELAYRGSPPPWDIGGPQPELVSAEEEGLVSGSVLDVGCGTGENAIFLASRGYVAVGIDSAKTAVRKAREKARLRGIRVEFQVHDALAISGLGQAFDTVVDSGLFHTFSDEERAAFARELHATLREGGRYLLMCFSELEPPGEGPRRVTETEIRATFADGFRVELVREARFASLFHPGGARAWLASIRRV